MRRVLKVGISLKMISETDMVAVFSPRQTFAIIVIFMYVVNLNHSELFFNVRIVVRISSSNSN